MSNYLNSRHAKSGYALPRWNPLKGLVFANILDHSKFVQGAGANDVAGWHDSSINGINLSQVTPSLQPLKIDGYANFGSQLLDEPDFDAQGDWILTTGVTISGGKLNFSSTNNFARQADIIEAGKVYNVEMAISGYTSGSVQVACEGNDDYQTPVAGDGFYTFSINAATNGGFYIIGYSGFTGSIDYCRLYEAIPDATKSRIRTDDGNQKLRSVSRTSWFPNGEATIAFKGAFNASGVAWQKILRLEDTINARGLIVERSAANDYLAFRIDSDTTYNQSRTPSVGGRLDGLSHTHILTISSGGIVKYYYDGVDTALSSSSWLGTTFDVVASASIEEIGLLGGDLNGLAIYDCSLIANEAEQLHRRLMAA